MHEELWHVGLIADWRARSRRLQPQSSGVRGWLTLLAWRVLTRCFCSSVENSKASRGARAATHGATSRGPEINPAHER
jgi:hypothetical protein